MKAIKKIISCVFLSVLLFPAIAQKTPSQKDIDKILKDAIKDLPADQQEMIKDKTKNINLIPGKSSNIDANSWDAEDVANAASIGTTTTKNIGSAGGIITTSNGKISINFPTGALTENTEISIEEIMNSDSSGIGNAFEIKPSGLILKKSAKIITKYTDNETDGTSPDLMKSVVEDKNGKSIVKDPVVDKKIKTTTITIDELSEISMIASALLKLTPNTHTLAREQSVKLKIMDGTYKLTSASVIDLAAKYTITAWKLNGTTAPVNNNKGILTVINEREAKYTAPKEVPLYDRVVTISVEMTDKKSGAKVILLSHIFLSTKDYFHGQFDGKPINATSGFDPSGLAKIKQAGINTVQCFFMTEYNALTITLADMINQGSITYNIINPHTGNNLIIPDEKSVAAVVGILGNTAYDGLRQKIRKPGNNGCDEKPDILHTFTINLSRLDLKSGGCIQGSLNGILYGDKQNTCKNSEEFSISGEFSLTAVGKPSDELIKSVTKPQPASTVKATTKGTTKAVKDATTPPPPPPPPPLTTKELTALATANGVSEATLNIIEKLTAAAKVKAATDAAAKAAADGIVPPPPPPPLTAEELASFAAANGASETTMETIMKLMAKPVTIPASVIQNGVSESTLETMIRLMAKPVTIPSNIIDNVTGKEATPPPPPPPFSAKELVAQAAANGASEATLKIIEKLAAAAKVKAATDAAAKAATDGITPPPPPPLTADELATFAAENGASESTMQTIIKIMAKPVTVPANVITNATAPSSLTPKEATTNATKDAASNTAAAAETKSNTRAATNGATNGAEKSATKQPTPKSVPKFKPGKE